MTTTNTVELADVLARLGRLEAENRRLRRAGLAVGLGMASIVLMGQARPGARIGRMGEKTVEAEHFIVRDETGAIRAGFGLNQQGGVGLWVNGQTRIAMGVNLEGRAGVRLMDETGKVRGALAVQPDGLVGLEIKDAQELNRVTLNVRPDGAPALRLSDKDGKERMSLVLLPDQSAGLLLTDSLGKIRGALAAQADGSSGLDLMDKTEKARVSVSVKTDGVPSLALLDERGSALFRAPSAK